MGCVASQIVGVRELQSVRGPDGLYRVVRIRDLLELSATLKRNKRAGIRSRTLAGESIALIFEKPSTRTRCAFTVACVDEGAHPEYLGKGDIQLGKKESVADTARVLGRMFDGIEFRGFAHDTVETLAAVATHVWLETSVLESGHVVTLATYDIANEDRQFLRLSLPEESRVRLTIYDIAGRVVRELVDRVYSVGPHEVVWDGMSDDGAHVGSGIYLYSFKAADRSIGGRMVLLK